MLEGSVINSFVVANFAPQRDLRFSFSLHISVHLPWPLLSSLSIDTMATWGQENILLPILTGLYNCSEKAKGDIGCCLALNKNKQLEKSGVKTQADTQQTTMVNVLRLMKYALCGMIVLGCWDKSERENLRINFQKPVWPTKTPPIKSEIYILLINVPSLYPCHVMRSNETQHKQIHRSTLWGHVCSLDSVTAT